jgi:ATP-dependent RNA circularization protein (DNA/RNA ligase family)
LELLETEGNTFWKVARELDLENKFKSKGNICLQGELIGEGIQGNPYKIKGQTVHFFNGFDIDTQTKLSINEFLILLDELELLSVPILGVAILLPETVEEMVKLAEDKSRLNKLAEREGVVFRSLDNTISFKAISNKFLLSEK